MLHSIAKRAVTTVFWMLCGAAISAAEPLPLETLLARPLLAQEQALIDVQLYCTGRIPRMPAASSADSWTREAERLRENVLSKVVFRGKAVQWRDAPLKVEWLETIEGGPGYHIKKLRYEILPGMWTAALLYEPDKLEGKVPVILNVNGHSAEGKEYHPKQLRCINQAKRGMLALNIEWVGMGQLRTDGFQHSRMNQLDLCGTSGLAPFYLDMKRGLDILLGLEHADPERLAVTGLSGGGWQTITLSSLDPRVKLCVPVAGYSSFLTRIEHLKDLGDSEQTPCDLATIVDYTHLTAMMAPRPTLLIYNQDDDCCFEAKYALQPLVDAATPFFELYGKKDFLRTHVNHVPGTHNYLQENREALYRMLRDHFYDGDPAFNAGEIPSENEIKTAEQLFVQLPEKNEDFNTLALSLAKTLPLDPSVPADLRAATDWQKSRRKQLAELVRFKDYQVDASMTEEQACGDLAVQGWKLKCGPWNLPCVQVVPENATATAVLVGDQGYEKLAGDAQRLAGEGHRVVMVDLTGVGKSAPSKSMLFALLTSSIGDRPLGIEAGQLAAIAHWAATGGEGKPVKLVAVGPRMGVTALVAAAEETGAIGSVELAGALGSLEEILEKNQGVDQVPELLCFGLLEQFDVRQIAALVAPRKIELRDPSERARQELAGLL
ncbi:MAG: alpha/beta hydrolase family protein [Thermoguttaceae bacterium]